MFDRLKAIDWQSLNASKLPDWIIGLTSSDENIYLRSYGNLQQYLCYYVDDPAKYEDVLATDAPVLATPFFVEFLDHPQTRKTSILYILEILGRYRFVEGLESPFCNRANQIYQILLSHFDRYLPFLDSDIADERIHVMDLLGRFEEKSSLVIDELLTRIENQREPDELGKRVAAENIYRGIQRGALLADSFSNRFIQVMQLWATASEETLPVRAGAAHYLLQLLGDKVDPALVNEIVNALMVPNHDEFSDISEYTDTLLHIGGRFAVDALLHMLEAQTDFGQIFKTAWTLLILTFTDRKIDSVHVFPHLDEKQKPVVTLHPYNIKPLNDDQREILNHLIGKEQIWEVKTNLFDLFSLPSSKNELKYLIGKD